MKSNESYEVTDLSKEPTVFQEKFGATPMNKILEYITTISGMDFNITELARLSGVAYITTKKLVPDLIKKGFLKQTRKIGKATMYTANMDNPDLKALDRLITEMSLREFKEYAESQKKTIKVRA